jgi:hypothetical protein
MRQRQRDEVRFLLMHKLWKDQRWTPGLQVCIRSTAEVSMRSDAGIYDQQLPHHLTATATLIAAPNQDVKKSARYLTLMAVQMPSGRFTERRPRAMTSPKFNH